MRNTWDGNGAALHISPDTSYFLHLISYFSVRCKMADNERHTLDELEAEELEEIAAKEKKESGFNPFRKTYSDGEAGEGWGI